MWYNKYKLKIYPKGMATFKKYNKCLNIYVAIYHHVKGYSQAHIELHTVSLYCLSKAQSLNKITYFIYVWANPNTSTKDNYFLLSPDFELWSPGLKVAMLPFSQLSSVVHYFFNVAITLGWNLNIFELYHIFPLYKT